MTEGERPARARRRAKAPPHPAVKAVVEDVFNVDFKFARTLGDLAIRPGKVADAALMLDHSRYTRPFKTFLAVVAVQALITGWLGYNDTGTFAVLLAKHPSALAHVGARLAQAGSSLAQADDVIRQWTTWVSWPLIMLSSMLYALAIWATRPSLGLINATLLYLVAASASNTITLPVVLISGLIGGPQAKLVSAVVGFAALFLYMGLVLHRRAANSAAGLVGQLAVLVLATVPVVILFLLLVFGTVEAALQADTGLSRLQLLAEARAMR
jgi:hypothetical protein